MTAAARQGHPPRRERPSDPEPPSAWGLCLVLGGLAVVLIVKAYGPSRSVRPVETAAPFQRLEDLETAELRQVPGMTARKIQLVAQAGPPGAASFPDGEGASAAVLEAGLAEGDPMPGPNRTAGLSSGARVPPAPAAMRAGGVRKIQPGEPPIPINRASNAELQRLPNVGPVLAQRIILARSERPFTSLEDLRRVPGIGPKTLEKLRPFVIID